MNRSKCRSSRCTGSYGINLRVVSTPVGDIILEPRTIYTVTSDKPLARSQLISESIPTPRNSLPRRAKEKEKKGAMVNEIRKAGSRKARIRFGCCPNYDHSKGQLLVG